MSNREEIIERSVRDYENKANSLYTKGYNEGHRDGCSFARKMGMADAWELIKRVTDMCLEDFSETFDGADCLEDLRYMDIDDIAERMKEYEDNCGEDIKVGDEVIDINGLKAIVTNADTHYHLFYPLSGKTWKAPKSARLKKTGRKFSQLEIYPL